MAGIRVNGVIRDTTETAWVILSVGSSQYNLPLDVAGQLAATISTYKTTLEAIMLVRGYLRDEAEFTPQECKSFIDAFTAYAERRLREAGMFDPLQPGHTSKANSQDVGDTPSNRV